MLHRSLAVLTLLAAASWPLPALAQQVTVTINGRPFSLNPGPVERTGRVFVPLRGVFERLGAGVVYSAGTINATKDGTTMSLHIGSTQATVNGQPQILDVAPFIIGATTYVPLRFIAQALGANVGYDESTRVVAIEMAHQLPPQPPPPVRPPAPRPPPPNPAQEVYLRAQEPPPGTQTSDRFAVVAARFSRNVQAASVRVRLDGNNVTYRSGVSSTGFSYKPPAPLDFGMHSVRVDGRASGGMGFDRSWTFNVTRSAPAPIRLTISEPAPNAPIGRSFAVVGNTAANASVRVTAGATPSSTGQFDGTTEAGPRGNFKLRVTLRTLLGQQAVSVKVTATDPATGRTAQTALQLRLSQ